MKSFLTSEEHLNFKRIEKILELRKESSALILLGSNTLELSKEIEKYFLEKENITKYITKSTNILYELTTSKNSDFKIINLYENKDINSIIKNLQFYRDFIPEHNLKLIFIFDYEGLEKLKEEAFDFFSTNSFSYSFSDHSYKTYIIDKDIQKTLNEKINRYNIYTTMNPKQEPKVKINMMIDISEEAYKISYYKTTKEYLEKALEIANENNMLYEKALLNMNIGTCYEALGNLKKALDFYLDSIKIHKQLGDLQGVASCLNNIGIIYKIKKAI